MIRVPILIIPIYDTVSFYPLKTSENFLISQNFCTWEDLQGMTEIFCWRQLFFSATGPIWMNNPSLESYYVVVFKYYPFDHLSYDIFAEAISASSISGELCHVASFNSIQPHLMFLA